MLSPVSNIHDETSRSQVLLDGHTHTSTHMEGIHTHKLGPYTSIFFPEQISPCATYPSTIHLRYRRATRVPLANPRHPPCARLVRAVQSIRLLSTSTVRAASTTHGILRPANTCRQRKALPWEPPLGDRGTRRDALTPSRPPPSAMKGPCPARQTEQSRGEQSRAPSLRVA